ncbi:MAG: hypothetical protein L6R39_001061 [Caloplaca ligustica]|nr:MAG: hypothetical protein L6R39_001061 [Caloplaca ligustica]
MPATDPTFQYSDEDWTQITQPRLRKRVQNRVSQRKHRNKLRQQRANSTEAGQTLGSVNASGSWGPNGSLPLVGSSDAGAQPHLADNRVMTGKQQTETATFHDYGAIDLNTFETPDFGSTHLTGIASQSQSPSYPGMPPIPSDYLQLPYPHDTRAAVSFQEPRQSSSTNSSVYSTRTCLETCQLEYPQQWYPISANSGAPTPYVTRVESAGPSPLEYSQSPSYTMRQPQGQCEALSDFSIGASPPYAFSSGTSVNGRSSVAGTTISSMSPDDGIEPRGLGIDPSYYKHEKHHQSLSKSKRSRLPRT